MERLFDTSRLRGLPPRVRTLAQRLVHGIPDPFDVSQLSAWLEAHPSDLRLWPVIWSLLTLGMSPARSSLALDLLADGMVPASLPASSAEKLWDRIWSWFVPDAVSESAFYDTHDAAIALSVVLHSWIHATTDSRMRQYIARTPGLVRVMCTAVAAASHYAPDLLERAVMGFDSVVMNAPLSEEVVEQLLSGDGGLQAFAECYSALVSFLARSTTSEPPVVRYSGTILLLDLVLASADHQSDVAARLNDSGAASTLGAQFSHVAGDMVFEGLPVVVRLLDSIITIALHARDHRKLRAVYNAPFIWTVCSLSVQWGRVEVGFEDATARFFRDILFPSLQDAGALRVLRPHAAAIVQIASRHSLDDAGSHSYTLLEAFARNLPVAMQALDDFRLGGLATMFQMECGNMECRRVGSFKACSRCKSEYYCSRGCQKADWEGGGHRYACILHSIQRNVDRQEISARDLAFVHSLCALHIRGNARQFLADAAAVTGGTTVLMLSWSDGEIQAHLRGADDMAGEGGTFGGHVWSLRMSRERSRAPPGLVVAVKVRRWGTESTFVVPAWLSGPLLGA